ncbi:unnamed protein product [Porites evermanni]|uniref:BRICHOS domain-containing protein n=1 Tax=Porites evermanni TaxID=104178 RepID=A0ABN8T0P2_9CNID|nr:unnamed protein product [Porites evermanni]
MIKDGGVFDQNVTINVAEQTVTFYVPLREGADEANVVHDFRKNLEIISLPEKKVCFISQLNSDFPRPVELIDSFRKAKIRIMFIDAIVLAQFAIQGKCVTFGA